METCSICLEEIKEGHIVKKLSCGHNYHYCCYKFFDSWHSKDNRTDNEMIWLANFILTHNCLI